MYFSRAELRKTAPRREEYWEITGNGHVGHRLVWSLFSDHPDRDRDFIYRWETDERLPVLYTVSEREPRDEEGLFDLRTKPYDPRLAEGQPLAFSLRANPVIKKRDEEGRQRVHDVVMNAKWEMKQSGEWDECDLTQAQLVQQEGEKWLRDRAERHGFRLGDGDVSAESHQKHQFKKPSNGRRVTFVTIDYRGRLTVDDPARFRETLFDGLGPTKAYGCGLLMVRPA